MSLEDEDTVWEMTHPIPTASHRVSSNFGDETGHERVVEKFGTEPLTESLLDRPRTPVSDDELHRFFGLGVVYDRTTDNPTDKPDYDGVLEAVKSV